MKILILDDETHRAEEWRNVLGEYVDAHIDVFNPEDVSKLIAKLHQARFDSRKQDHQCVRDLDEYGLIIIDYDLLGLQMDKPSAWATGAELAYCMRLNASVGSIVVVNQFGTNSFDLTMRRGISSYADTDVGSLQIVNKGLWMSSRFEGFRPWHWPNLKNEIERFSKVKRFVLDNLDSSVMDSLGFNLDDSDLSNFVNYEVAAYIGASQSRSISYRQMVLDGSAIRVFNSLEKDREILQKMPDAQLAGVGAAILMHWLEKVVLPAHEVVSDAPHLCIQMPWLVTNADDINSWNSECRLDGDSIELLSSYEFQPSFLFSRKVYWAESARREIQYPEGYDFDNVLQVQFCEDHSKFFLESECSSFPSDVLAFDKKRWVFDRSPDVVTVNYEPQSYLLM
jgi:hypothetical protein